MERHQQQIARAGLQSVVVAQGEPKHAERYCGIYSISNCLVRNDTIAYTAYGLRQGSLGELVGPGVIAGGVRALAGGHVPGETIGDSKMMPGTFIVDREGRIAFSYYGRHAADHPRFDSIFAAARALQQG